MLSKYDLSYGKIKLSEEIEDVYIPLDPQGRSSFASLGAAAQVAQDTRP